jgi:hypothetical protein
MANDATPKQSVSPAAVPETLAELQKVLKDNAEALRSICELIDDRGLPKVKLGGAKPKVLFDDALKYVTGQQSRRVALARFRNFLAGLFKMSEQHISTFLETRVDRWPATLRRIETDEEVESGLPSSRGVPTYADYGGFLLEELESLKVVYQNWWNRQINAKRKKNLSSRKKKKEE